MKQYKSILSVLIMLIMMSCQNIIDPEINNIEKEKITLTTEEYVSIAYDNPRELTEKDVLDILNDFNSIQMEMKNEIITRNTSKTSMTIKNKYYILEGGNENIKSHQTRSSDENLISIPIYELESASINGKKDFAVVCGDERAAKVIFYAYKCSSDNEMDNPTRFLLEISKKSILADINEIEQIKKELRTETLNKISTQLNIPVNQILYEKIKDKITTVDDFSTRSNPPGGLSKPTNIVAFVNPMSKVTWDQIEPYNYQMPKGSLWSSLGGDYTYEANYDVGCGNIAVATLFSIIKPPMSGITAKGKYININWNYITSQPSIVYDINDPDEEDNDPWDMVEMTSSLMRRIYNETKSYPNYVDRNGKRGIDGTITDSKLMINYLKRIIHFSGDGYSKFNPELVKRSLFNLKPVLLWGNGHRHNLESGELIDKPGHAWLIDGCFVTRKRGQKAIDHYWSVNMGWGVWNSKGYFLTSKNLIDCDIIFKNSKISLTYKTREQNIIYNVSVK